MTSLPTELRRELRQVLEIRRERTLDLLEPLTDGDVHQQVVDFLSPLIWDLGHIGNFEELWLLRQLDGRPPHDAALDQVYNPFENPRWVRAELDTLDRPAALTYLKQVRGEALSLLDRVDGDDPLVAEGYVHRMIAQHESQHQETILQALDLSTTLPPFPAAAPRPVGSGAATVDAEARVTIPSGDVPIGTDDLRWTYDNERPQHTRHVSTFEIDVHPVTNRRYARFVEAGGYEPGWWWSDLGRDWVIESGHNAPQGWRRRADGSWGVRRLGWDLPLDPMEPVQHVSYFEAEAFANWSGARLPTEFEWEAAALWNPATGTTTRHPWGDEDPTPSRANVGLSRLGPMPIGSHPQGASPHGVQGLASDVYEWTTSPFEPYDNFTAFPYPEYSEVFFGGDWKVLRGASWAIAGSMARGTYRNWDHPYRRQIFAGIRLAWDVSVPAAAGQTSEWGGGDSRGFPLGGGERVVDDSGSVSAASGQTSEWGGGQ